MRAVVLKAAGAFGVETVEDPRPTAGDLLLRVLEGTKTKGARHPSIIGHEFAGIVDGVGHEVTGFSPGDRVSVAPVIACRACRPCMEGRENACQNRRGIGYEYDGGFAQFVRIPDRAVEYGHVVRIQQGSALTRRLLPNRCPAASTACGKLRWVSGTRPNCEYQFGAWVGGFGWTDGLRGEQRRPGGHDPGLGRGTGIGGDPG